MSPILGGIGGISVRGFGQFVDLYAASFDSIATVTVDAGGASSITFNSIPAGYTHLQIRGICKTTFTTYANDNLFLRFNGESGTNYAMHQLYSTGSIISSQAVTSFGGIYLSYIAGNQTGSTNMFSGLVVDILDYRNTSKNKTIRGLIGDDFNGTLSSGGTGTMTLNSGFWNSTAAVTSLSLTPESGTIMQYSSFALYGIKVA